MAYNGSGTFNRVHNFATDKTNLVPVTASRMDAEMDGIATGLSTAIAKDGQTQTSARIPFAAGASAFGGATSGVSYAQTNDPNTGLYFPASDQYGLVAGGTATITSTATVVTVAGDLTVTGAVTGVFPAATTMLFAQTAAPTGWTKNTDHNNKALRIVSGTCTNGGTTAFTSVFAARTITQGNLPAVNFDVSGSTGAADRSLEHNHSYSVFSDGGDGGASITVGPTPITFQNTGNNSTTATGGVQNNPVNGTSIDHEHGAGTLVAASGGSGTAMDFDVAYIDVILAYKN